MFKMVARWKKRLWQVESHFDWHSRGEGLSVLPYRRSEVPMLYCFQGLVR
jgi:hypothetical protein